MKPFQKYSLSVLCVFSLMTMIGCVPLIIGAAAGAGSMIYIKGSLVRNVDHTVARVNKASVAALKDLGLFVMSDELNKRSSVIKAEYEDGKSVSVFIDALTERSSKITIRIGVFGDQDRSQGILNVILMEL